MRILAQIPSGAGKSLFQIIMLQISVWIDFDTIRHVPIAIIIVSPAACIIENVVPAVQ